MSPRAGDVSSNAQAAQLFIQLVGSSTHDSMTATIVGQEGTCPITFVHVGVSSSVAMAIPGGKTTDASDKMVDMKELLMQH